MGIRYDHIGEGHYQQTERAIREALEAVGKDLSDVPFGVSAPVPTREGGTPRQTRELYMGWQRNVGGGGPYAGQDAYFLTGTGIDTLYFDVDTSEREHNFWYLEGLWRIEDEAIVHARTTDDLEDYVALLIRGRTANVVLTVAEDGEPFRVYVELDGRWLFPNEAGSHVLWDDEGRSYIRVTENDLYRLVFLPEWSEHELRLSSDSDQFRMFAFTFGSYVGGENVRARELANFEDRARGFMTALQSVQRRRVHRRRTSRGWFGLVAIGIAALLTASACATTSDDQQQEQAQQEQQDQGEQAAAETTATSTATSTSSSGTSTTTSRAATPAAEPAEQQAQQSEMEMAEQDEAEQDAMQQQADDGMGGMEGGMAVGIIEEANYEDLSPRLQLLRDSGYPVYVSDDGYTIALGTPDLAPGAHRISVVIEGPIGLVEFPALGITVLPADAPGEMQEVVARFSHFPDGVRGFHVTTVNFTDPGRWNLILHIPSEAGFDDVGIAIDVPLDTSAPSVGDTAPPSQSGTLDRLWRIADLSTGETSRPGLYLTISTGRRGRSGQAVRGGLRFTGILHQPPSADRKQRCSRRCEVSSATPPTTSTWTCSRIRSKCAWARNRSRRQSSRSGACTRTSGRSSSMPRAWSSRDSKHSRRWPRSRRRWRSCSRARAWWR